MIFNFGRITFLFVFVVLTLHAKQNNLNSGNEMATKSELLPPKAEKKNHEFIHCGETINDNYFWLKDKSRKNKTVANYIKAENNYTKAMTQNLLPLQDKIYKEMIGRISENDMSVPVKRGDYTYYVKEVKGKEYSIYCRKFKGKDEEVFLDENKLAEKYDFFEMDEFSLSTNQNLLAFSVDTKGNEEYRLFIKDLETGKILKDSINKIGNLEWANDNKTIFYTTIDKSGRTNRVYRHNLGDNSSKDKLLHEEKDGKFYLSVDKSRSKRYLYMYSGSKITTEIYVLDLKNPMGEFKLLAPKVQGVECDVVHHGDFFYMRKNDGNRTNFRIVKIPVNDLNDKTEFWGESKTIFVNALDAFENYLVIYNRKDGLENVLIHNFKTGKEHYIKFPEDDYSIDIGSNYEYDSDKLRFSYSSFVTPYTVYDYNMTTKKMDLLKKQRIPSGYESYLYESKRVLVKADDGTLVPLSLVYKKGMKQDGKNPIYLEAYGSYGDCSDVYFSTVNLALLNRDFIIATAHIRGGGEFGDKWYNDGKILNKKNTFTDFINCSEYLIKNKYTSQNKLVIEGGSAGGLLIGAVLNMRPELFKIAIADVPFVDVVNTMLDTTLSATVSEYEEWGNPNKKEYFDYIRSYSPYDNVKKQDYPNMLIIGGMDDPRVNYWEPAKFTAKLRDYKTDNNILLLKINIGGHGGASGRYEYYKDTAFKYAFVFDLLGIKE